MPNKDGKGPKGRGTSKPQGRKIGGKKGGC